MPIKRNNNPTTRMQLSFSFFAFLSFRSRYSEYSSCFALPIGMNVNTTFLRTNPIPNKAPSPLIYSIMANIVNNIPDTKNASDKIWIFTAILSVKKPFIQITINESTEATQKQMIYFFNSALFSFFIML